MRLIPLLLLLIPSILHAQTAKDLHFLTAEQAGGPPKQMLSRWLKQQAFDALDRRKAVYEKLKTPADIEKYQQRLRQTFLDELGEFPEKTPLNAKTVGAIQGDRY